MDAGRQRASNDRVLDGDLIANRNSSAKHKKVSVAENKRLFLPVPGEYSDPRDCSIAERAARPRSIYTCTARYRIQPPRINSIVPMQPVHGGHLESRACARPPDIDTAITGGKGAGTRATRYIISAPT